MEKLRLVCFTICLVCIALAVLFGLVAIWGNVDQEIVIKGFLTLLLFFGAAGGVALVSDMLLKSEAKKKDE